MLLSTDRSSRHHRPSPPLTTSNAHSMTACLQTVTPPLRCRSRLLRCLVHPWHARCGAGLARQIGWRGGQQGGYERQRMRQPLRRSARRAGAEVGAATTGQDTCTARVHWGSARALVPQQRRRSMSGLRPEIRQAGFDSIAPLSCYPTAATP